MALAPGGLVDVTTPDGRRISVPSSIAGDFAGFAPVDAPPPENQQPIQPAIGQAPPAAPQLGAPLAPEPIPQDLLPPPLPPPPVEQTPASPAAPAIAQPSSPPAAPAERPLTNKDLRKLGNADALAAQDAAVIAQQEAAQGVADAQADEATKVADAMAEQRKSEEELLATRAATVADQQKWYADKDAEFERMSKEINATKVNRDLDHPILAGIGIALSAIGGAMGGTDPTAGIKAVMAGIDRKVAAQMSDLERKRAGLGDLKTSIAMGQERNREYLQQLDARRIAAIDVAKGKVEEVKTRSLSSQAKANADVVLADLEAKRAEIKTNAITREQEKVAQERAAAAAAAARRQDQANWERQFAEGQRQFNVREQNDLAAAQAAAAAKGQPHLAEMAKDLSEKGIRDPATGQYLLNPKGQQIVAQANKAEEEAKGILASAEKIADPAQKQALIDRASAQLRQAEEVRGAAIAEHAVKGRNASNAEAVYKTLSDTQTALTLIDEAVNLREQHGANWFVETGADKQMKSKIAVLALQIKEAYKLGALDVGSQEYLDRITGGDPTKVTLGDVTGMFGSSVGTTSSLQELGRSLELRAKNELAGVYEKAQDYQFRRSRPQPKTKEEKQTIAAFKDQTPLEAAKGEKRTGVIGKIDDAIGDVLSASDTPLAERRETAAQSQGTLEGLTKRQSDAADTQIALWKRGGGAGSQRAADLLLQIATDTSKPERSNAMLSKLQTDAPDLYQQALQKLPDAARGQRESTALAASTLIPARTLLERVRGGDTNAQKELARRAAAGDREAIAAVKDMAQGKAF